MNPFVFFVGCPRSGTTLLGRMGDAHPDLAVVHESRWIPRCFEYREGLSADGRVTSALADRLSDPRALKPMGIDEAEMQRLVRDHDGAPFASFVTALFDGYGERQGKPQVGDKSPGYVRYLPTLHALWPEAKFVHLIRDGRDICLSVLDWRKGATRFSTYEADPITTIAVWWEWYVQLGREAGSELGPDLYHEVRYEALVAEPELEARRICHFLGLDYDPAMLRFHQGRTKQKPTLSAKSAWLPVTGGLRDWRTQMDPGGVQRFEAAAGAILDELGYPRAAPISKGDMERASRVRETFAREVQTRRRPLPRAWASIAPV